MALGTALTASFEVSTTIGLQHIALNSDGISVAQTVAGTAGAGGKLTVFLMGHEYDYKEGNEPTSGGDETKIKMYYYEYTNRPRLSLVMDDASAHIIYAEGSGNDDDGSIGNANLDDSVNWATLRGDETTSAGDAGIAVRNVTSTYLWNGVYSYHAPGRGSDVIRDIRRSIFVFDISGLTGTIDSGQFSFYMDNVGDTGAAGKVIAVQGTALAGSNADYGNCFVADAVTVTHNATFFGANF